MSFVKSNNKFELVDETRHILRKSIGIKISENLLTRIVNRRSERIREGIEEQCPRILIEGVGSFKIKSGKKQNDNNVKKGRIYYVKKANKHNLTNIKSKFATKFKIVSNDEIL